MNAYRNDPRPSQTDLKNYWTSPKAGDWAKANQKPPTAAMELGTLVHDLVLVGETALEKYRTDSPINDKTQKPFGVDSDKYKVWKSTIEEDGYIAANPTMIAKARMMAAAVSDDARAILAACDHVECPVYWDESGVQMKGRPDAWKAGDYLVEVKTTCKPLTERALTWEAKGRLYDLQCAAYRNGIGGLKSACIIWITAANGGDSAIMWLDETWQEGGQAQLDRAIENYKKSGTGIGCAPTEFRPAYPIETGADVNLDGVEEIEAENE